MQNWDTHYKYLLAEFVNVDEHTILANVIG